MARLTSIHSFSLKLYTDKSDGKYSAPFFSFLLLQQCQPVIEKLERELAKLSQSDSTINEQVEFCTDFFSNLTTFYQLGDLILKRQIIGLIYPEKFVFKENAIQTIRPHAAIPLICRTGVGFDGDKNKMPSKNGGHSNVVNRIGLFSNRLREELSVLYKLKLLIFK